MPDSQEAEPYVAPTTQDAIERAFKEMGGAEEAPEAPAEPEVVAEVPETPEAVDAAPEATDGPLRGPDGKFAPKPTAEPVAVAPEVVAEPEIAAPSRFHATAKADWAKTPASIRGEVDRTVRELEGGLTRYQQAIEPLKPFLDHYGGPQEMARYINGIASFEGALRQNPAQGMAQICQSLGVDVRAVAAQIMGQPAPARDAVVDGLTQKIAHLEAQVGTVHQTFQQQQQKEVVGYVEGFAKANPRFDELSRHDLKVNLPDLIRRGYDLETAYEIADRANPGPAPEPQTLAPTTPAPQTRKSSLSVQGAPGSNPGSTRIVANSTQDAIARAAAELGIG